VCVGLMLRISSISNPACGAFFESFNRPLAMALYISSKSVLRGTRQLPASKRVLLPPVMDTRVGLCPRLSN
jgi:hypothetical protein